MSAFRDRLRAGEVLVADGAMGTLLLEEGLEPGQSPEQVNLERPEVLQSIAGRYLAAGADILHTNTFGGSSVKLADYGLEDRTEEINETAVAMVRSAVESADREVFVSCSCGPSGRILEPYGDTAEDVLYAGFERQLRAVVDAGVDLITIETMTDLREAVLAVTAARAVSSDIPVVATMSFEDTPRGFFTIMGVSIEQAAAGLAEAGADLVGSNCGYGIETMVRIARAFADETELPTVIQSNAGIPETRAGGIHFPETPEFFAEKVSDLLDAGVAVVGGCCGSTPDHIQAIRRVVDAR
jgi:5-methyltetrahydrofolate--homocysteine methyltransferase